MKVLVSFSSLTGNTKKIAEEIYNAIPCDKLMVESRNVENITDYDFDTIAIGYWVDKGLCDNVSKELISCIENKNVILFGTLGAKDSGSYYDKIKANVEASVPKSNKILGHFLCQGKINERLTERYVEMLKANPNDEHIKEQLKNHKEALLHPNEEDFKNAKNFIENILK